MNTERVLTTQKSGGLATHKLRTLSLTESEEAGAESHVACFAAPCVLNTDHASPGRGAVT